MSKTEKPHLSHRFDDAVKLARVLHHKQIRKGSGEFYVSHLLAVSSLVMEGGGDEDTAIAALLHDTVEDCGGKPILDMIRRDFGDRVASIVDACTDTMDSPKPPWRKRKEDYVARLRTASRDICLVVCADKLHNTRCTLRDFRIYGSEVWKRFHPDADSMWYYRAVLDALIAVGSNDLVRQLEETVVALEVAVQRDKQGLTVVLREPEVGQSNWSLDANIGKRGDLSLTGFDFGDAVKGVFDSATSSYEWWVTVDREYKDEILLKLLRECFEGDIFKSDTDFREWLKVYEIPSEFGSWISHNW